MVVSRYIPKPLKVELKKQGINYLEASGNCFINQGGILFFINDETVTPHRLPKEGKLWKSAGLKFLFAILQQPELLNEPYRNIAKTAGVALGNIGPFIEELINHDFLKQQKDGRFFLDNRKALIVKWAEFYVFVLKLKLKTGTFRFLDTQNVQNWKKIPDDLFYWGGEPAGAILTGFLQPENFTLYTTATKMELMKELMLVPDVKGNIELVNIFWDEELFSFPVNKLNVVPPLLASQN